MRKAQNQGMEKIKKTGTQRFGAWILALLVMLTIVPFQLFAAMIPTDVSAASGQVTRIEKIFYNTVGSSFRTNPIPGTAFTGSESGFWKMYVNGEVAYCTEYRTSSNTGDSLQTTNLNGRLNSTEQTILARAISFGYNQYTSTNPSWEYYGYGNYAYMATQIMVWQIFNHTYNTGNESRVLSTLADGAGGGKQAVIDVYNSIKGHITTSMQSNPFAGQTYSLTWNQARGTYCVVINDPTGGIAYNNFDYSNNGNLHVAFASPTALLIETQPGAARANQQFTITARTKGANYNGQAAIVDGVAQAWTNPSKQDFISFTPQEASDSSTFNVWVEAGVLDLYKTADDNNVGGKQFSIVGQRYGYTATLTTDGNGHTTVRVPVDTYTVTEINVDENYDPQPASQVIEVTAAGPSNNNYTRVDFYNRLKNFRIEIHKTAEGTGAPLRAGFSVVDENGNVVQDVNGNEVFYTDARSGIGISGDYRWRDGLSVREVELPVGYKNAADVKINYPSNGTAVIEIEEPPREWNVTITKEDQYTGERLSGAQFQIFKLGSDQPLTDTNNQNTFTADSDGVVRTGNFLYDGSTQFYAKEVTPPTGTDKNGNPYVLTDTVRRFSINSNDWPDDINIPLSVSFTVDNAPSVPLRIHIEKSGIGDTPLGGVTFNINAGGENYEITTDAQGNATLENIASNSISSIYISELDPPSGYDAFQRITISSIGNYEDRTMELTSGSNGTATITIHYNETENRYEISISMQDPVKTGDITVQKVDQNGEPVQGATFALYEARDSGGYRGDLLATATTNETGIASFDIDVLGLDAVCSQTYNDLIRSSNVTAANGTNILRTYLRQYASDYYVIEEISAPEGYKQPTRYGTHISDGFETAAVFTLTGAIDRVASYSQPNGYGGYYTVHNVFGSFNFVRLGSSITNESTVQFYNSSNADFDFVSDEIEFTCENEKIEGTLNGQKVGYINRSTTEQMAGVEIGLWQVDSTDEESVREEITNESPYETTVTSEEEPYNFSFTELPVGNYAAQEISTTGNHILSDEVFIFTVDEDNETNTFNWTLPNYTPIEINGTKVDSETQEPLAGATIELYQIDTTCPNCEANMELGWVIGSNGASTGYPHYGCRSCGHIAYGLEDQSKWTDTIINYFPAEKINETVTAEDGTFSFTTDSEGNPLDPNGVYKIVESEAPFGYTKSDDVHSFQFTNGYLQYHYLNNGQQTVSATNIAVATFTLENTPTPAKITGMKYGTDTDGNVNPLAGATIGLFDYDDTNTGLNNPNAQYYTTGSDGVFEFTGLDATKHYKVLEVQAPAGFEKSNEVFDVDFTTMGEPSEEGYVYNFATFYNPIKEVYVDGVKYSVTSEDEELTDGTATLSGVTIGLFDASVTDFENSDHQEAVTDENGYFRFNGLNPNGSYKIVELATDSKHLLNDEVYTVTFRDGVCTMVNGDEIVSDGNHATISMKNPLILATVSGHKTDGSNNLAGAVFGLFDVSATDYNRDTVASDPFGNPYIATAGSDGIFTFKNVAYGNYKVVEIEGVDGHMLDQTPVEVTVTAENNGQTINIGDIENPEIVGRIVLEKTNQSGEGLNGVIFGLYTSRQNAYNISNAAKTATTGWSEEEQKNGIATFEGLGAGTYYIVELSTLEGYELDPTVHTVTISGGDTGTVYYGPIINPTGSGEVEGRKVNNLGQGLSGAKFGLFKKSDTVNEETDESYFVEANVSDDVNGQPLVAVSADDGSFSFENVPYGDYILSELEAPSTYERVVFAADVAISERGDYANVGDIVNMIIPENDSISGRKVDEYGAALDGATFGLFDGTEVADPTTAQPTSAVPNSTCTTSGEGYFTFEFLSNTNGDFCIYEISAPEGYDRITDVIWYGTVQNGKIVSGTDMLGQSTVGTCFIGNIVNPSSPPGFTTIEGRKVGPTYEPLSGAVFQLLRASDNSVAQTSQPTGEDGVFRFANISYDENGDNEYYIIETVAPANMQKIDGEVWRGTVTENPTTLYVGDVVNYEASGSVEGYKVDENGNGVNGAVIGIFDSNETVFTTANAYNGMTVTTSNHNGRDGYFSFSDLPFGDFKIAEIQAPAGYVLDNTPITVTINSSDMMTLTENIVNPTIKGSIEGYKVDEEDNGLNGAVIGLFDASETNYTQSTARATVTSANAEGKGDGYYRFDNVPYGNYKVVELVSPDGYIKSNVVLTATISQNNQVYVLNDLVNTLGSGTIAGQKTDEHATGLAGATIGLYDSVDCTNLVDQDVSADDGSFSFESVKLGTYYVKEIDAPDGFYLSDTVYEVTLNTNGQVIKINGVEQDNLTIVNTTSAELPNSGGEGDTMWPISIAGIGLMLIAGLFVGIKTYKASSKKR